MYSRVLTSSSYPSPTESSPHSPLNTSVYLLSPRYSNQRPYPPPPQNQMTPPLESVTLPRDPKKDPPVTRDPVVDYLKVPQPAPMEKWACSVAGCDFLHFASENKLHIHEFKYHEIHHPSLFYCNRPECMESRKCFPTQGALKQHQKRDAENEAKRMERQRDRVANRGR